MNQLTWEKPFHSFSLVFCSPFQPYIHVRSGLQLHTALPWVRLSRAHAPAWPQVVSKEEPSAQGPVTHPGSTWKDLALAEPSSPIAHSSSLHGKALQGKKSFCGLHSHVVPKSARSAMMAFSKKHQYLIPPEHVKQRLSCCGCLTSSQGLCKANMSDLPWVFQSIAHIHY